MAIITLRHAVPAFPTRTALWLRLIEANQAEARPADVDRLVAAA